LTTTEVGVPAPVPMVSVVPRGMAEPAPAKVAVLSSSSVPTLTLVPWVASP